MKVFILLVFLVTCFVAVCRLLNRETKKQPAAAKAPKWDVDWPHSYEHATVDPELLHRIHHYQKLVSAPVFNASHGNKIPRIIHQIWNTRFVPNVMKTWMSQWQVTNPEWVYMFWTHNATRAFLTRYFKPLRKTYDDLKTAVDKANMFRCVVMYAFGGVYADTDMEPLKALDPIRDWAPCIVSQEPVAHTQLLYYDSFGANVEYNYTVHGNGFMACRPGHPFFFNILSRIVASSFAVTGKACPLNKNTECTGTMLLTKALTYYKRSIATIKRHHPEDDVVVADADVFQPTFDKQLPHLFRSVCTRRKSLSVLGKTTCNQLKARNFANNEVTEKSYTNHHWFHSYAKNAHALESETFYIRDVIPKAKIFADDLNVLWP